MKVSPRRIEFSFCTTFFFSFFFNCQVNQFMKVVMHINMILAALYDLSIRTNIRLMSSVLGPYLWWQFPFSCISILSMNCILGEYAVDCVKETKWAIIKYHMFNFLEMSVGKSQTFFKVPWKQKLPLTLRFKLCCQ